MLRVLALLCLLGSLLPGVVSSPTDQVQYTGTGAVATYPVPYPFKQPQDLVVTENTAGVIVTQTLTVNYTVAGAGLPTGGSITLVAGNLTSGVLLTIARVPSIVQLTSLPNGSPYFGSTIEGAFDIACMQIQATQSQAARSIQAPLGDAAATFVLPGVPGRANSYLGFDSNGNVTTLAANNISGTAVTAAGSTTPRLLATRFAEVANALDFGATGNGSSDDTAALQAAIATGHNVYVPRGSYLLTSALALQAHQRIYGDGASASILIANTNGMSVISGTALDSVEIDHLEINGGGQTTNINTGIKGVFGVYLSGCRYFKIHDLYVHNCGTINVANPQTDSGFSGYGIIVDAIASECAYGEIARCRVANIAGGGNSNGDGIYVGGQNASLSVLTHDVTVNTCWVTTCGRHCSAVAEGAGTSIPVRIGYHDCTFQKAALCGIDIEEGANVTATTMNLVACGNDQTYYNPASAFGATYNLLAGIATGNTCINTRVEACYFTGCYYGITYGTTNGLQIAASVFDGGTAADLWQGLAGSPTTTLVTDCLFKSTSANLQHFLAAQASGCYSFKGCRFVALVKISTNYQMHFAACEFDAGISFVGSGSKDITFSQCKFYDFAGDAVSWSSTNAATTDLAFATCEFVGLGNLVNGINVNTGDVVRMDVQGCTFRGLTGNAVYYQNLATDAIGVISGNKFISITGTGVLLQSPGSAGIVSDNYFESCGNCITANGITAAMKGYQIIGNLAGPGNTNGLTITTSGGGAWDYCVVSLNNMHQCLGTPWSLSTGNADGVTANNVTS